MSIGFYIGQVIIVLFTVFFAHHNAPSANHFSNYGALPNVIDKFHKNGFRTRMIVVAGVALLLLPPFGAEDINNALLSGVVNAGWSSLLFDPILNKSRKVGLSWDYIGTDDGVGRRLIKLFGSNAGEWKAIISLFIVVATNILYVWI